LKLFRLPEMYPDPFMKINHIPSLLFILSLFPLAGYGQDKFIPQVREIGGQVSYYDEDVGTFLPLEIGRRLAVPTLINLGAGSELFLSFPGRISARVGENSRVVIGPAVDGLYEVDLRLGTVTASLDPERDFETEPAFAIRTKDGITQATGTYFAVTEYKGQSYSAVKKGKVKKKTTPPNQPNFAAYLNKPKEKVSPEKPSEKNK